MRACAETAVNIVPPIRIADAVEEPVSMATAKSHLRIDGTEFDALLPGWIAAARRRAEHELGRVLIKQTWEIVLPEFCDEIQLPKLSVLSVGSVKYMPADGGSQITLDESEYVLDESRPGMLLPTSQWPGTADVTNAVRIRWDAGYGNDESAVPRNIIVWMLLQIGAMHRHTSAVATATSVAEMPGRFVDSLLDAERVYW